MTDWTVSEDRCRGIESRIQTFNRVAASAPRQAPAQPDHDNGYEILGSPDLEDVGRSGFADLAEAKVALLIGHSVGVGLMTKWVSQRTHIKSWKAILQCSGLLMRTRGRLQLGF